MPPWNAIEMKLHRRQKEKLVFRCSPQEASLLLNLLNLFPLVPLSHHRLTRKPQDHPKDEENQRLLEEAVKAEQAETVKWIQALTEKEAPFKPVKGAMQFALTPAELELVLQVLNDVRVGSWLTLGSPEAGQEEPLLAKPETEMHVHRMELAGLLQMSLLKALNEAP
jgi:hypothetical protein